MSTQTIDAEPEIVYHYTSMDTFLKIVDTKQLWATNVAYLNDTTEQEHFFERAVNRLPHVLSNRPEYQAWDFSDVQSRRKMDLATVTTSPFLTSFSSDDDSLPQWRAYCAGGNGISIGFRVANLKEAKLHLGSYKDPFGIEHPLKWGRVEYDCNETSIDRELDGILRTVSARLKDESANDRGDSSPGDVLRSYVRSKAVFYKQQAQVVQGGKGVQTRSARPLLVTDRPSL